MGHVLLDTGPLVALLDQRDQFHEWAMQQVAQTLPPLLTCEPVLTEAFYLLRARGGVRLAILDMVGKSLLQIRFRLDEEHDRLKSLLRRYHNVPMSLADACLVRMSETIAGSTLLTLDGDFRIYRQHGRQAIPLLIPPNR
jgi:predicted nucleic acid-binding protein